MRDKSIKILLYGLLILYSILFWIIFYTSYIISGVGLIIAIIIFLFINKLWRDKSIKILFYVSLFFFCIAFVETLLCNTSILDQYAIIKHFYEIQIRMLGYDTFFMANLIFMIYIISFVISTIILVLNIKQKMLTLWQKILSWIIIASVIGYIGGSYLIGWLTMPPEMKEFLH